MSVVRYPFPFLSGTDSKEPANQNDFVRLSDADRVLDEPDEFSIGDAAADAPAAYSVGSVEHASVDDDAWSGLEVEQTLGQIMTESRRHRGLSREQVAEQTHIPAYYVRMIESDSYDAIPDQLYLLPFFERYAIFLGLDSHKVVARFIRDFEKAESEISEAPAKKKAKPIIVWPRVRRIVVPAAITVILLPCVVWGVGTLRTVLRDVRAHRSAVAPDTSPAVAVTAPAVKPLALAVPVPVPVLTSDSTTTAAPVPVESNVSVPVAPASVAPATHAQTRHRRSRSHQIARHRKHSRHT